MRAVIQRVISASVTIDGVVKAGIDTGMLVLVAFEEAATAEDNEQHVRISNPTPQDFLAGVRLFVSLGNDTTNRVWNATGTNKLGVSYIDVHTPAASGSFIDVLVQYYVPNVRAVPVVQLSAEPLPFVKPVPPAPTLIASGSSAGAPFRFNTVRGQLYLIEWSEDLAQWRTLPGLITGSGAPAVVNAAGANRCRFYRVLMFP